MVSNIWIKLKTMRIHKIFIGSSTPSADKRYLETVANAIRDIENIPNCRFDVDTWLDNDVFKASTYTWESLIKAANSYDAAVFIFGPDDTMIDTSKFESHYKTRDNVILEFGLFNGTKSTKDISRVAVCRIGEVVLPSDLLGRTYIQLNINENDEPQPNSGRFRGQLKAWLKDVVEINDTITNTLDGYHFIKFDIVDSSYIYSIVNENSLTGLTIFDEQLSLFRNYINSQDCFTGLQNLVFDDICVYGLSRKESKKLNSILDFCANLLLTDMDSVNEKIKLELKQKFDNHKTFIKQELRDLKVRISILTENNFWIINSTTLSHFKGRAINISSRFKFFGNYNSLTVDKAVLSEIGDKNNQFTDLDLKIDNKKDFYWHKDILNKQILLFATEHFERQEYVFASDFLLQYHFDSRDNSTNKSILKLVDDTLLKLRAQALPQDNSFTSKLRSIYQPVKAICTLLKSKYYAEAKDKIYKDYEKRVLSYFNFFFNQLEPSPCHTHYWILYGLSPKNYFIDLLLKNTLKTITKDKGIHEGCSLCSSKNAICFSLLNHFSSKNSDINTQNATHSLNGFLKSPLVRNNRFCVQDNQTKDLHYLAYVMQAAIVNEYGDNYLRAMLDQLNLTNNWLDHCESNSLRLRGLVFASLAILYKFSGHLFTEMYREKFKNEFMAYLEESRKYTYNDKNSDLNIPSPLVLDGIEGMLETMRHGFYTWLQMSEKDIEDMSELIEDSYKSLMDNALWSEDGLWGYERQRTYYRISFWFKYWEYKIGLS